MLTVFTPTYNRAYILPILHQSLLKQTSKDFEWIIIDDESTDHTEDVVMSFTPVGCGIRYYKQKHGGKHRAINQAVKMAKGHYLFIVDSDDYLTDRAVELVNSWIEDIPKNSKICGVAGLRMNKECEVWGGTPVLAQSKYIEATNLERKKFGLLGDKAEVYSTDIPKKYPFPEFEGEDFVTEATVWDAIAADGYKLRWYHEPIYVTEYLEDGLTKNGANGVKGFSRNYKGFCSYISVELNARSKKEVLTYFMSFIYVSRAAHKNLKEQKQTLNISLGRFMIFYVNCFVLRIFGKVKNICKGK